VPSTHQRCRRSYLRRRDMHRAPQTIRSRQPSTRKRCRRGRADEQEDPCNQADADRLSSQSSRRNRRLGRPTKNRDRAPRSQMVGDVCRRVDVSVSYHSAAQTSRSHVKSDSHNPATTLARLHPGGNDREAFMRLIARYPRTAILESEDPEYVIDCGRHRLGIADQDSVYRRRDAPPGRSGLPCSGASAPRTPIRPGCPLRRSNMGCLPTRRRPPRTATDTAWHRPGASALSGLGRRGEEHPCRPLRQDDARGRPRGVSSDRAGRLWWRTSRRSSSVSASSSASARRRQVATPAAGARSA
jgi:hypothetical protein